MDEEVKQFSNHQQQQQTNNINPEDIQQQPYDDDAEVMGVAPNFRIPNEDVIISQ